MYKDVSEIYIKYDFLPINLQWFASAEDEGRTEDPTDYKIRKAREEGRVAKSPDLASAIVMLCCVMTLGIFGKFMMQSIADMMGFYFNNITTLKPQNFSAMMNTMIFYCVKISLPLLVVAVLAALLGNVLQVGFLYSTKPITPDFKRIAPRFDKWLEKSLFSTEALYNLAKSLFKVAIIGMIGFINISANLDNLVYSINVSLWESFSSFSKLLYRILFQSALALLILAIPDYLFQRHQFKETLKMTKQEIKDEMKQSEGDPLVKNRMRERMKQILTQNMILNVPKADVVVTNPTHFALALQWEKGKMTAPVVIAKGQDEVALRIREVAKENAVPIVENKPLARALYAELEIGDEIPEQYYEVISVILAEIYKLNGKIEEAV